MRRQTFDQWKVPKTPYTDSMTVYVQCDCGELAEKVYGKYHFACAQCKREYVQQFGDYVEVKKKGSGR